MPIFVGGAHFFTQMANKMQSFVQKLLGIDEKQPQIIKAPNDSRRVPFTSRADLGLPEIPPKDSQQQLEAYKSWTYACVRKIAEEMATIELELYKRKGVDNSEKIDEHPALDVLYSVNPQMTFYDLVELYSIHMELVGEHFWWMVKSTDKEIMEIYPYFLPYLMKVIPDTKEFVKGYVYTTPGKSKDVRFDKDEMIMFKYTNPNDVYRGISPVKAADYAISGDEQAVKYNWHFFKNSAQPPGVLSTDQEIDDDTYEQLKMQWDNAHKGSNRAGVTAILEKGLKYEPIAMTFKDMQFADYRRFTRDEILAIFNVPKSVLGIVEDVNRANAEASIKLFREQVIKPKMTKFVNMLNEYFLPMFDERSELYFDFVDPAPEELQLKLQTTERGLNDKWMTVNEARDIHGYDPIEGGDEIREDTYSFGFGNEDMKAGGAKRNKHNVKKLERSKIEKVSSVLRKDKEKLKKLIPKADTNTKDILMWREKVSMTDKDEVRMKRILIPELERQAKQVSSTLREKKTKSLGYTFNIVVENETFKKLFLPLFTEFVKRYGELGLRQLGLTEFSSKLEVERYANELTIQFAKQVNQTTQLKIREVLKRGLAEGESIPDMRRKLTEVVGDKKRADLIARTETTRASNLATMEAWKQSGVVLAKQWVTAEDERVCPYCAKIGEESEARNEALLDEPFFVSGETIEGNETTDRNGNAKIPTIVADYGDILAPPLHPRCRCTIKAVPISKSNANQMLKEAKIEKDKAEEAKAAAEKAKRLANKAKNEANKEKAEVKALIKQLDEK